MPFPTIVGKTGCLWMPLSESLRFADLHSHSRHSHDGKESVSALAESALQKGFFGITVTDHADLQYFEERRVAQEISASLEEADRENARLEGRLRVWKGVELGEAIWEKALADSMLRLNYDLVISSVHAVRFGSVTDPYSTIDFSLFSKEKIQAYLKQYFEDVLEMAQTVEFQVLSHLTCPLRYLIGKYHREVEEEPYRLVVDEILKTILSRGIALEVNTSDIGSSYGCLMPHERILSRYRALGGRLITLGSDAHRTCDVGKGFSLASATLEKMGFSELFYYEKKNPCPFSL